MSDTIIHTFILNPPDDSLMLRHTVQWRVACTPTQARRISEAVEELGWSVTSLEKTRAMSLEMLADEFGKLKLITQVGGPSPWDEHGNWTPDALKKAREGAVKLYDADGKLIDPDAVEA